MAEPCIQDRVIGEMQTTLIFFKEAEVRREGREERMLVAMESVAAQGAVLQIQAKRIDKHDEDISEAFGLIRGISQSTASKAEVDIIKNKLDVIELRHAEDHGENLVIERQTKFWDGVKQQVTPYVFIGIMFILWLFDKFNIGQAIAKLLKEMKG
ncbi:MAG: hypothetical protein J0665_01140 [Deltaproteobacteria bacterium]|nr:hypothetical protein [Deltaproteobacteria bacterium]